MSRLASRLGGTGGSSVRFERFEIDLAEHATPGSFVPLDIPAGSVVLAARLSSSTPPPPPGQGVGYMLLLSGEDALVYIVDPDPDGASVRSHCPGQVSEFGVVAAFQIADLDAPTWDFETAYEVGQRVSTDDGIYVCTQAGTSSADSGPTGTGTGIVDGTVIWDWQSALPTLADWGQTVAFEIAWTKT